MVTSLDCYILGESIKHLFSAVIGERILLYNNEITIDEFKINHLRDNLVNFNIIFYFFI
jgi:hypothetical protein